MTPEQETRVAELWRNDVSSREIARIVGTSSSAVRAYAASHRDECPPRAHDKTLDEAMETLVRVAERRTRDWRAAHEN